MENIGWNEPLYMRIITLGKRKAQNLIQQTRQQLKRLLRIDVFIQNSVKTVHNQSFSLVFRMEFIKEFV
jgi:hypothetical protein